MSELTQGRLARWNDDRGFGFVQADALSRTADYSAFVSADDMRDARIYPSLGMRLRWREAPASHGRKPRAVDLQEVE